MSSSLILAVLLMQCLAPFIYPVLLMGGLGGAAVSMKPIQTLSFPGIWKSWWANRDFICDSLIVITLSESWAMKPYLFPVWLFLTVQYILQLCSLKALSTLFILWWDKRAQSQYMEQLGLWTLFTPLKIIKDPKELLLTWVIYIDIQNKNWETLKILILQ